MKRFLPAAALFLSLLPMEAGACPGGGGSCTQSTLTETFLSGSDKFYMQSYVGAASTATYNFDLTATGNRGYQTTLGMVTEQVHATPDATGYTAGIDRITSARLFFSFRDDSWDLISCGESATIALTDGSTSIQLGTVGAATSKAYNIFRYLDIINDGSFGVTLTATSGDMYLTEVKLVAGVERCPATPTPIPAAGCLLASGLAGMIGMKRRRSASA